MVTYLAIGIVVGILESIMAYIDLKKLGLTIYDINPKLKEKNQVFTICNMILTPIFIAIVWPWQVYHWIRRIVSHMRNRTVRGSA